MNEQDQRVRDYYQNLSMSQDKMNKLMEATSDAQAAGIKMSAVKFSGSSFWNFGLQGGQWGAWAGVGLACGLILTFSAWMLNSGSQLELTEHTLREVAMNHSTRLEPEFRGNSLTKLDNSMHQLPFALVLPKSIAGQYELVGSRYCSLSGVLAAHVKLQNRESGKSMSLFVTSNAAELEEIKPQQASLEGVEVEFWREGGLFYALAQRS